MLVVVLVVVVVVLVVLVPRLIDIARLMQVVPMEAMPFQIRNLLSSRLWIAPTCKWSRVEHSPDALRTSTRRWTEAAAIFSIFSAFQPLNHHALVHFLARPNKKSSWCLLKTNLGWL